MRFALSARATSYVQPQFFDGSVDFAPHLMVGIFRGVLKKMSDSIDKAVDDIRVDKSWGIAGGPAKFDLDRVAIFGHPISKLKQNPFEDGPIQIEFDNRGHQTINDCDEVDRLSLRRGQLLEKYSYFDVLDCLEGWRNKVA